MCYFFLYYINFSTDFEFLEDIIATYFDSTNWVIVTQYSEIL